MDIESVRQLSQNIKWLRSTSPYGHTGIMIQTGEQVIFLDPADLENTAELPKGDIILVTHEHGDHFSSQMVEELSGAGTTIVSIESVTRQLADLETITLSPGEKVEMNDTQIEGVPAYNAFHSKGMNHLGFIVTIDGVRVYCSGDTGFNDELKILADIDIVVLNVRKPYALSGEEVIEFVEAVKPKELIPIHWMPDDDTYQDKAQIEFIQENLPGTTELLILELK